MPRSVRHGNQDVLTRFARQRALVLVLVVTGITVSDLVGLPVPSEASFPGTNGRIVFQIDGGGTTQIAIMKADGSGLTQITSVGVNTDPIWSPDGRTIAFVRAENPNSSLLTMNPQGGAVSTVIQFTGQTGIGHHPSWSPDGAKLLFSANSSNGFGQSLWVVNVDGSGLTELTHFASANVLMPAWSPNGDKIAFVSETQSATDPPGVFEIFVMNPDGNEVTQLTHSAFGDFNPDWSPDGARLVFNESGRSSSIVVMNADGSNPTIVRMGRYSMGWPRFSPNGHRIVFASAEPLCAGCNNVTNIYTMQTDGKYPRPLTTNTVGNHSVAPDWQPRPIA